MASAPSENTSLVCVGPVNRGRGRPSLYSDELAREICERIAAGETLTGICQDDDMPSMRTVSGWLMRRPDFYADYARAREAQAHIEAEQIREIADNAYEDYYIDWKEDADGNRVPYVVVNGESTKRAALRIDARKWRAERLNRTTYAGSSSVKHEHTVDPTAAAGQEQLPPGIGFLAQFLPPSEEKP